MIVVDPCQLNVQLSPLDIVTTTAPLALCVTSKPFVNGRTVESLIVTAAAYSYELVWLASDNDAGIAMIYSLLWAV
jgi:hypothetical protein